MKKGKSVVKIPAILPIAIVLLIILALTYIVKESIVANSAQYTLSQSPTTEDGRFIYNELEDGTIEIIDYLGEEAEVIVPEKIEGKNVTSIALYAFSYKYGLNKVTIPKTVTNIGSRAFIASEALTEIEVESGNKNYLSENGILFNKEKTEIICYPTGKTNTSYTISEGITSIGEYAFAHNGNLTQIIIAESVTNIAEGAFSNCINLVEMTIPEGVTYINGWTFEECESLKKVVISKETTNIDWYAFSGCNSLEEITIPEKVEKIESYVFERCTSLNKIDVDENNPNYLSENGILFNKAKTEIIRYPSAKEGANYTIPDGITTIGRASFESNKNLTEIIIPESVTAIEAEAFMYSDNLTKIKISNSITRLEQSTFYGCTNLKEVTLPEGLTVIQDFVFGECTSLTEIVLPEELTIISWYAFRGCSSLKEIVIPEKVEEIGEQVFSECTSLEKINVDTNNANYISEDGILFNKAKTEIIRYPAAKTGSTYTIPAGITTLRQDAFESNKNLTKMIIPENVINIDYGIFRNCTGLTEVTLPKGITSISYGLFSGCTGLTNVVIPEEVTMIESFAFAECTSLSEIVIPQKVTDIDYDAFSGCTGLTQIIIPENVKNIESYAFSNCTNLTDIILPEKLTKIGEFAFAGSRIIKTIENGTTEIELPTIFKRAMDKNDILYCNEDITLIDCTLSEDKTKLILDADADELGALMYINDGILSFIELEILPLETNEEIEITSEKYTINDSYISNVQSKTTIENFKKELIINESAQIDIYNEKNELQENTQLIGTGMKIEIKLNDEIKTLTVAVRGDVDGDGKVAFADLSTVNRCRLNKIELKGADLLAADLSGDGKVNFADLSKVNAIRLNRNA